MSRSIEIPEGADIRICTRSGMSLLIVAPPPQKADPDMFERGGISGLFTFDPGLTWPNQDGCRAASAYLKAGCPIAFIFEALRDALVCRERLAGCTVR